MRALSSNGWFARVFAQSTAHLLFVLSILIVAVDNITPTTHTHEFSERVHPMSATPTLNDFLFGVYHSDRTARFSVKLHGAVIRCSQLFVKCFSYQVVREMYSRTYAKFMKCRTRTTDLCQYPAREGRK